MAASVVSPRVSWTAWRLCRSLRTVTASATTTACFARLFAAAGSRRRRRTGSSTAIPGSSSVPNTIMRLASAAGSKWSRTTTSAPPMCGIRPSRSKRAADPLKLEAFNAGDYIGAFSERVRAEAISKVLYPSDATPAGQELRLRQEYFFTSASLLDLIRRHVKQWGDVRTLGEHAAVQLNDTHPAIGISELMRILVDLNKVDWDEAW